jgi:tetratricopeptide (TPR) repeat protein
MDEMRAGDTIDHRFQVELEVAAGGMGRVFRASDLQTGQSVAIKVLGYRDPRARDRFLQEARMLAEIRHPGIVRYIAHGIMGNGAPYLVMEWLEGENLAQHLERIYGDRNAHALEEAPAQPPAMRVTLAQALHVGRRLASAVAELHKRGFVHRDIKPANLFLAGGSIEHVKLIDFGTVQHYAAGQRSEPGRLIGTPFYMSPEQARSEGQVGPPTDVWAIGCVLYECLTGYKAFWADNVIVVLTHILMDDPLPVQQLRPEVPDELASLVMRALAKAPVERPPDARALAHDLEHLGLAAGTADTMIPRAMEWPSGSAPNAATSTLTEVERRVSCLVFAGHAEDVVLPGQRVLASAVQAVGAELERLANGTLLVTIPGTRAPTDQAARAARAALALREAAPSLSMVLATGRVEGPRQMPQIRVLTQAARTLQHLGPSIIRVDALTATLLDHRFHIARDEQEGGYLVAERPHESTRTLLGKPTRWVGRQRELNTLLATFTECVEDEVARAVLVTAPAGMGKSRLRYEFERALRDQGHEFEVLRGQGDAVAAGSPFIMLAPAIRRLVGIRDGEPLEERRQKLERRLAGVIAPASLARVTVFLGEMIGVPFPAESNDALRAARKDPMLQSQLMQKAWEDWLAAECERTPVLLLLEDLHWGDLPSVTYVDGALRSLQDAPFMVLALARPEVHTAFPNLWAQRALSEVPLHPLSRKASLSLVRDALGDQVSEEVVSTVIERAGGNAFYLEELIRAVSDASTLGPHELPDTIVGMVHARLDALGNEAKRVLRAASVFGEVFWDGGVEALLGDSGVYDVHEWLDDLVAGEIVTRQHDARIPGQDEYTFRHALMREGAYAMLTVEDRRLGHRLAGAWLERAGEQDQLVLAEHFLRGGDSERAIPYFQRAAAQALESNDLRATVRRAEQAIMAGAQGAMLGALRSLQSVASYWLSDYAASRRYGYEAAELLPPGSAEWFAAVGSALVSSARTGAQDSVTELLQVAMSATCAPGAEAAQLVCLSRGTFQLVFQGRLELADQILDRIETLARHAEEHRALDALTYAQVRHLQSLRAAQGGDPNTYLPHLEAAVEAFERAGDIRNVALERTTLAWTWAEIGFLDRAAEMCRSNLDACIDSGNQQAATYAKLNLGYILSQIPGRRTEARRLLEETIAECQQAGNLRQEGWASANLAWIDHEEGDYAAEERHVARALELLAATPGLRAWAMASYARALLALGRVEEALPHAREAMALLEQLGSLLQGATLPPLILAQALDATGHAREARAAMAAAVTRLQRRAARFTNPEWRSRFLALLENRRTLELARAWGVTSGPSQPEASP